MNVPNFTTDVTALKIYLFNTNVTVTLWTFCIN